MWGSPTREAPPRCRVPAGRRRLGAGGGGATAEEVDVVELVDLVEARLLNNSGGVGIGGEEDGVGRQLPLDEEGMDGWD